MGFSDAIYWSLVPEWVNWVTVGKDGRCHGWESKPEYSENLGRWINGEHEHAWMTIPQKDATLAGLWERPKVVGADFVLVANGQVGAKLKAQFDAYLTDSAIQLTPVQRKLSDVILEAAAGDSQLMQLLTEPAGGLSFVLRALDGFGDEKKRGGYKIRLDTERSTPIRAPYLTGNHVIQMQDKR